MKHGYYFFAYLTTAQKIKFRENRRKQRDSAGDFRHHLSQTYKNMTDFLFSSFTFFKTKQGHDYWEQIANQEIK